MSSDKQQNFVLYALGYSLGMVYFKRAGSSLDCIWEGQPARLMNTMLNRVKHIMRLRPPSDQNGEKSRHVTLTFAVHVSMVSDVKSKYDAIQGRTPYCRV